MKTEVIVVLLGLLVALTVAQYYDGPPHPAADPYEVDDYPVPYTNHPVSPYRGGRGGSGGFWYYYGPEQRYGRGGGGYGGYGGGGYGGGGFGGGGFGGGYGGGHGHGLHGGGGYGGYGGGYGHSRGYQIGGFGGGGWGWRRRGWGLPSLDVIVPLWRVRGWRGW